MLVCKHIKARREFLDERLVTAASEALTDSIPRAKINRLVEAAHHYIQEEGLSLEVRFDVIQVIREGGGFRLVHLEDAFYFF